MLRLNMLWWNWFVSSQFLQFAMGISGISHHDKNVGRHRCVS
jgi:hypothetical protein